MEDGAEERLEKRRKLKDGAGTRLVTPGGLENKWRRKCCRCRQVPPRMLQTSPEVIGMTPVASWRKKRGGESGRKTEMRR